MTMCANGAEKPVVRRLEVSSRVFCASGGCRASILTPFCASISVVKPSMRLCRNVCHPHPPRDLLFIANKMLIFSNQLLFVCS